MPHTVVNPVGSVNELQFPEVDELYLCPATATLASTDLIPSTAGVPRIKGNRQVSDVNLDSGTVLKIPGRSADYGTHTVPLYAPPSNAKVRALLAAVTPGEAGYGALWKGNAFYRDGSGFSFFTYINNFGPAGDDDFHFEFDVSPFDVKPIGALTAPVV